MGSVTVYNLFSEFPEANGGLSATISSDFTMVTGVYFDGTPWVAPAKDDINFSADIISVSPAKTLSVHGSPMNGIMMNIPGGQREHGYDGSAATYNDTLNEDLPLRCTVNDVVITASSNHYAGYGYVPASRTHRSTRSFVAFKMPIYFLSSVPENPNDFRPSAYGNKNNRLQFKEEDFDPDRVFSILEEDTGYYFDGYWESNTTRSNIVSPDWDQLILENKYFMGDDISRWTAEDQAPAFQAFGYGQTVGQGIERALWKLMFTLKSEDDKNKKRQLLKYLTQRGIDLWSAWLDGRYLESLGGHSQGRKAFILLAGIALNNQEMKDPNSQIGNHPLYTDYGRFQTDSVFFEGVDLTYDLFPSAVFNGWRYGHNFQTENNSPTAVNAWMKNHPSTWTTGEVSNQKAAKYWLEINNVPQMGQSMFAYVHGLADEYSKSVFGQNTQTTFGMNAPLVRDLSALNVYNAADWQFVGNQTSAVVLGSYGIASTSNSKNFTANYFRKFRLSNDILSNLSKNGLETYGVKAYTGVKKFTGPYLITNESIHIGDGEKTTFEIFLAPSGWSCSLLYGPLLENPFKFNAENYLYIDTTNQQYQYSSVQTVTPGEYGVILNTTILPSPPAEATSYGIQAVFQSPQGDYMSTNAIEIDIGYVDFVSRELEKSFTVVERDISNLLVTEEEIALSFENLKVQPASRKVYNLILEKIRTDSGHLSRKVFYETLKQLIASFGSVKYVDANNNVVPVKCFHSSPERTIASLYSGNNITLPVLTIGEVSTQSRQGEGSRYSPILVHEKFWDPKSQRAKRILSLAPRPITLTYNLNIWTKFKNDLDQIREFILLMFNPDLEVKTQYSNVTKAYITSESDESTLITQDAQDRVLRKTISINVETWVPYPKYLYTSSGKIETFNFEFDIYK